MRNADDLAAACDDDTFCLWVAQGLTPRSGARAWVWGPAVLIACPDLSNRDRALVWGEPAAAARLVTGLLPRLGPDYRLLGHADLITELARRLPGLSPSVTFGWMNTLANGKPGPHTEANGGQRPETVRWLGSGDGPAVRELLERSFPDSYAWPGTAGVRRWAGVEAQDEGDGQDGRLLAVAADAWSAPTVGFMAGVAVSEKARGRGLGGLVCAFVLEDLIARHGRAALMVDGWNDAAIRLYQRLGLVFRPVKAARADLARS